MCCRVLTSQVDTSASHTIPCFYQSYHRTIVPLPIPSPSTTFFGTTGTSRKEQTSRIFRRCSTVRSNPSFFQSPTLRAASQACEHYTLLHKHISLQCLSPIWFYSSFASAARALLLQKTRKMDLRRATSTSHLRPSSRRRMPALATHISAPNLLFAPTTSISTYYPLESKLHYNIEVFD
jgi:hypothetical protein